MARCRRGWRFWRDPHVWTFAYTGPGEARWAAMLATMYGSRAFIVCDRCGAPG